MSADAAVLAPATTAEPVSQGFLRALIGNFFLRSILKALFTIFFVTTLSFLLIRMMPGSPMEVYVNDLINQYGMTYSDARAQANALFEIDLEQPLYVQY